MLASSPAILFVLHAQILKQRGRESLLIYTVPDNIINVHSCILIALFQYTQLALPVLFVLHVQVLEQRGGETLASICIMNVIHVPDNTAEYYCYLMCTEDEYIISLLCIA